MPSLPPLDEATGLLGLFPHFNSEPIFLFHCLYLYFNNLFITCHHTCSVLFYTPQWFEYLYSRYTLPGAYVTPISPGGAIVRWRIDYFIVLLFLLSSWPLLILIQPFPSPRGSYPLGTSQLGFSVVNFSSLYLTTDQIKALEKGLTFFPTPSNSD